MAPPPLSLQTQRSSDADPAIARVRAIAAPLCLAHRVQLVDVAWGTEHGSRVLRVTIERRLADGQHSSTEGWGVTLEDCADVSRDLSQALDADESAVPGSYNLEVSSPGLERALLSIDDFVRFTGKLARAKLSRPAPDKQKLLRGEIVSLTGDAGSELLTMRVDGKALTVPFADVASANLVFELAPAPKKAPARRSPESGRKKSIQKRGFSKGKRSPTTGVKAKGSGA